MGKLLSQMIQEMQAILEAEGDMRCEIQAEINGKTMIEAKANSVMVKHEDGESPKCLISSNDGIE